MPNIKEYTAPNENLVPSALGTSSFLQIGRRLGPLYNEAATFQKQAAATIAGESKEQLWPYDILSLYAKSAANAPKTAFRVQAQRGGGGSNDPISDFPLERMPDLAAANAQSGDAQSFGQIVQGAGALGMMLRGGGRGLSSRATATKDYNNAGQRIDPDTGLPLDNPPGFSPNDQVLQNGELISYSQAQKAQAAYNANRDAAIATDTARLSGQADYWQRYYSGGYNPSTGEPVSPSDVGAGAIPPPIPVSPASDGWSISGIIGGLSDAFSSGPAASADIPND